MDVETNGVISPEEAVRQSARILMDQSPAEAIAVALLRMYRARLPEPEDLYDGGPFKEHGANEQFMYADAGKTAGVHGLWTFKCDKCTFPSFWGIEVSYVVPMSRRL